MSTSLLYHAFGVRGYDYTRTRYEGGAVIFSIRQETETCRCSSCGSARVIHRGQGPRRFRSLPLGGPGPHPDPLPPPALGGPGPLGGPPSPPPRGSRSGPCPPGRGPFRRSAAELPPLLRAV